MPVLPRRRHEIGEPVEELKGQEVDDAVRPRSRGLSRADLPGSYTYSAIGPLGDVQIPQTSAANRPITYVNWFDAARFTNWMSNGQPTGAQGPTRTENGACDLTNSLSGSVPAVNATNPNTGTVPLYHIPTLTRRPLSRLSP